MVSLPWPPSLKNYWVRRRGGGVRMSDEGTRYQEPVRWFRNHAARTITHRIAAVVALYPPD